MKDIIYLPGNCSHIPTPEELLELTFEGADRLYAVNRELSTDTEIHYLPQREFGNYYNSFAPEIVVTPLCAGDAARFLVETLLRKSVKIAIILSTVIYFGIFLIFVLNYIDYGFQMIPDGLLVSAPCLIAMLFWIIKRQSDRSCLKSVKRALVEISTTTR